MDHPLPVFNKERRMLERARAVLAGAGDVPLAGALTELADAYQLLLERVSRVTDMALAVQADLDAAVDQVSQLAQQDGLTGAVNRRYFEKLLARDWATAQRQATPLSLVLVNIDFFRAYNGIYGPQQGDDCLKSVARAVMRGLYREVDVAGRMEDDTFAALLPGAEEQGAWVVAERIAREVRALEIPHLDSPHGGVVTVSAGLASLFPARDQSPMVLIRLAQRALGEAKRQGRDAVVAAPAPAELEPE